MVDSRLFARSDRCQLSSPAVTSAVPVVPAVATVITVMLGRVFAGRGQARAGRGHVLRANFVYHEAECPPFTIV